MKNFRKISRFAVVFLLIWVLLGANEVLAVIAYDTASSNFTNGATQLTWTHTVTSSGSNRLLTVGVHMRNTGGETVTSVKYNNVDLTQKHGFDHLGNRRTELWYLVNPATGANTVEINVSSSHGFVGGAMSFTGVDQTTPLGTHAANEGTSADPNVTVSSASGEIVIDAVTAATDGSSLTADGGNTERYENVATPGSGVRGAGSTEDGAASVQTSWSITSIDWGIIGVPIKPAAEGAASPARTLRLFEGFTIKFFSGRIILHQRQ